MPTEEEVALEARLIAIEHLLAHLARTIYLLHQTPDSIVSEAHENIRQGILNETFSNPAVDPVLKDHFAATIYEHVDRLLKDFERALAVARGRPEQQ
jgi:hypothetical protein